MPEHIQSESSLLESVFREVKGDRIAWDMASSLLLVDVPSARSSTAARGSRLLLELDAAMAGGNVELAR
jgi:hypothetical protein